MEALLSNAVDYLQKCRTLAVSVINAHKNLKQVLMQLPNDQPESEVIFRISLMSLLINESISLYS